MSRSILGVYTLPPGSAAVDNTIIDPVIYNALLSDLEADLNIPRPIVAGGTGAASADGALTALGGTTTGKAVFTAADIAAALVALGLSNAQVPAGNVGYFAGATAPAGWLAASGQAVSRTTYAALFAYIGTIHGPGDGSTTFNLPDLRGEFIRGLDSSRGVDTGRALGSAQAAAMLNHTHGGTTDPGGAHQHGLPSSLWGNNSGGNYVIGSGSGFFNQNVGGRLTDSGGTHSHGFTTGGASVGSGTETRPRNVALLACIKT